MLTGLLVCEAGTNTYIRTERETLFIQIYWGLVAQAEKYCTLQLLEDFETQIPFPPPPGVILMELVNAN